MIDIVPDRDQRIYDCFIIYASTQELTFAEFADYVMVDCGGFGQFEISVDQVWEVW